MKQAWLVLLAAAQMCLAGRLVWECRYDCPEHRNDSAAGMSLWGGSVYLAGTSDRGDTLRVLNTTVRVAATTGQVLAVKAYRLARSSDNYVNAVTTTASGAQVVVGGSSASGNDYFVAVKYDTGLNRAWDYSSGDEEACFRAVSAWGDTVCAVGDWFVSDDEGTDIRVVLVNPPGDVLWSRTYGMMDDEDWECDDEARGVCFTPDGSIVVTGCSPNDNTSDNSVDYVTIKYSPSGDSLWSRRYNSGLEDDPAAIASDGSGNVYVTGTSDTSYSSEDLLTIKYSPSGAVRWVRRYDGGLLGNDRATSLALGPDGKSGDASPIMSRTIVNR